MAEAAAGRPRIFLSYRRNDSTEQTDALYEALSREFVGDGVFMDRRTIAGGEDFHDAMLRDAQAAAVVVVVIGPHWAGARPDGSRRIDDAGDAVRLEVERALAGCTDDRVLLPVLVAGATMPRADELPSTLAALCTLNALAVRTGADRSGDLDVLLARLHEILDDRLRPPVRAFLPRNDNGEAGRFEDLHQRFRNIEQALESLLLSCSGQVDALRHQAECHLKIAASWEAPHPALARLAYYAPWDLTHLDDCARTPLKQLKAVGNLTAAGDRTAAAGEDRVELDMALRLGGGLFAAHTVLDRAAWVYYTSASRFIHIFPWAHSSDVRYSDELLTHHFFTHGGPELNPQRHVFWTPPYVDVFAKGMMVTVAAPVYRGDTFLGTVAADLGVDMLNDFVGRQRLDGGTVFVVDSGGLLVAAPGITSSHDSQRRELAQALPAALRDRSVDELLATAGPRQVGRHLLLVAPIADTDWLLVHVRERREIG